MWNRKGPSAMKSAYAGFGNRKGSSRAGKVRRFCLAACLGLLALPFPACGETGNTDAVAAENPVRKVLVLHPYDRGLPWGRPVRAGFDEAIAEPGEATAPELFEETLDGSRLGGPPGQGTWAGYLAETYRNVKIDAVFTESTDAAALLLGCPRLFPGAYRCFFNFALASDSFPAALREKRYPSIIDLGKAVDNIWQVLQETREVIAVVDHGNTGLAMDVKNAL